MAHILVLKCRQNRSSLKMKRVYVFKKEKLKIKWLITQTINKEHSRIRNHHPGMEEIIIVRYQYTRVGICPASSRTRLYGKRYNKEMDNLWILLRKMLVKIRRFPIKKGRVGQKKVYTGRRDVYTPGYKDSFHTTAWRYLSQVYLFFSFEVVRLFIMGNKVNFITPFYKAHINQFMSIQTSPISPYLAPLYPIPS